MQVKREYSVTVISDSSSDGIEFVQGPTHVVSEKKDTRVALRGAKRGAVEMDDIGSQPLKRGAIHKPASAALQRHLQLTSGCTVRLEKVNRAYQASIDEMLQAKEAYESCLEDFLALRNQTMPLFFAATKEISASQ